MKVPTFLNAVSRKSGLGSCRTFLSIFLVGFCLLSLSSLQAAAQFSATSKFVPYKGELGPVYHDWSLHYPYRNSYQRIQEVDFRNLTVPILFGENGGSGLRARLKNGRYFVRHFPWGFDSVKLDSVHILSSDTNNRQYAMVWYTWTSGYVTSKSVEEVAYIFELKDQRLILREGLHCDKDFDASGPHISFKAKSRILIFRNPHSLQDDPEGVVSAMDIFTLRWNGNRFVPTDMRTQLSPQGVLLGSKLQPMNP